MFIHITSGLIFLYLFTRVILPLKVSRPVTVLAGLLLLFVTQQHFINRTILGSMSSPELPFYLLVLQGWLFVSLIFLFVLCLARDLVLLARFVIQKIVKAAGLSPSSAIAGNTSNGSVTADDKARLRPFDDKDSGTTSPQQSTSDLKYSRRQALMLVLAGSVPAAYGVHEAVADPDVKHMDVRLPRLPKELDGLRIAHITDLHASPLLQADWVTRVVDRVNALEPDLILFTGDIVDGLPARRDVDVAPLAKLKARYGIFSCAGNHEYYSDYTGWMRTFPALGIRMLLNSHEVLTIKGKPLVIAGTTDIAARRFNLPLPDSKAALAGAPEDAVRIMLDHRPGNIKENAPHGIDLQLSGHTHGGHMTGMTRLVARFNDGYIYGWYKEGGTLMYVSSGVGLWCGFPVRLGVPSEIPHLTLRCAEA